MSRTPNNKAPGRDLITGLWLKRLTAIHGDLILLYSKTFKQEINIPEWLVISKSILLPKNKNTHMEKNYRPIACLNTMYKIYTGILNVFLEDHCSTNDIITLEQAGGKKGSWGCSDQLLINKLVLDEVRKYRRNLFCMWFDYRKAFDSIPHTWLFEALTLAKIPQTVIEAIKRLAEQWKTEISLQSTSGVSVADFIDYLTGILQGDCLSLILFVLCVNPLSHLLKDTEGYMTGEPGQRNISITHLLFVDDLKTFAKNETLARAQLEVITAFTNDIGMEFGADKCAFLNIERGQRIQLNKKIMVNGLELSELEDGDSYKYLGMDEDIRFQGKLNKENVTKEYYRRVRKIWKSELYSRNKALAYNCFAIPVLTPTFGILEWTKEEVHQIDVKTRKILTLTGNFHRNSSVDRLYTRRDQGGRGLNSVFDVFLARIISLARHIDVLAPTNPFIREVRRHEEQRLMRCSAELCRAFEITNTTGEPKIVTTEVRKKMKDDHAQTHNKKPQHGFIDRKQQNNPDINQELTHGWLKTNISSHVEGYIVAIQEQEIRTRDLQKKREHPNDNTFNNNCRYCHSQKEDIFHILASCNHLSASLYLPVRHDEVGKVLFNAIIRQKNPELKYVHPSNEVWHSNDLEIWWDTVVKTTPPVKHNKPDLIVWDKNSKKCFIIDVCVPLDQNIQQNEKLRQDRYLALSVGLKRIYPPYEFTVVPIVLGATGLVTNSLVTNLTTLGFVEPRELRSLIQKLQMKALVGSMRVMKSAMTLKS